MEADGCYNPRLSKSSRQEQVSIHSLTFYDSQDPLLRRIANGPNVAVISVGYRLSPENPYPKGPEDCFDAGEWLVDNAQARFGTELRFLGGEVSDRSFETETTKSIS